LGLCHSRFDLSYHIDHEIRIVGFLSLFSWRIRSKGEPYNPLINLYIKPDSARIQRDQHEKSGKAPKTDIGRKAILTNRAAEDRIRDLEQRLREIEDRQKRDAAMRPWVQNNP
jgi:hypothetical protein